MFIVIGILSILAGGFVFRQGSLLSLLSAAVNSEEYFAISGGFILVAICLIIAGICSCACRSGEKRGFVKTATVFYFIATAFALIFRAGDLKIWAAVCGITGLFYIGKLISLNEKSSNAYDHETAHTTFGNGSNGVDTSFPSVPEKNDRWVFDTEGFCNCPECGKHMSRDFILARGKCPACGYSYWLEKPSEIQNQEKEDAVELKNMDMHDAIWVGNKDGFSNCPCCGKHLSLDYLNLRRKCPACGCEYDSQHLVYEDPAKQIETENKDWALDEDGFTKCPSCGAYMSGEYVRAKGACPKCGTTYTG